MTPQELEQLKRNISLLEAQGAPPEDVQAYINQFGSRNIVPQAQPMETAPSGFNTQAFGDVFRRAGEDVSFAWQNQAQQGNSFRSMANTAITTALQGGLALPRAVGAGLAESKQGRFMIGNVIEAMTKFGDAITPDSVQEYIGNMATEVIAGYEGMTPQEQLAQRNKLALAELLSYYTGGTATKNAVISPTVRGLERLGQNADSLLGKTSRSLDLGTPRSVPEALKTLESAFYRGFVEDSPKVLNAFEKIATKYSTPEVPVTRSSLIRELISSGTFPELIGKRADFTESVGRLSDMQSQVASSIDNLLAPRTELTNLVDLKAETEAILRRSPQIDIGLESALNQVERFFESLSQKTSTAPGFIKGKLNPLQLNQVRKNMNRLTKAFRQEAFNQDVADALADAVRERLDAIEPRVRPANQEWKRLQIIKQTAKALQFQPVNVGVLGNQLGRLGAVTALGATGLAVGMGPGALVVAGIVAHFGGDAFANLIRKRLLSPKAQKVILDSIKANPNFAKQIVNSATGKNKTLLVKELYDGKIEPKFEKMPSTSLKVTGSGKAQNVPIENRSFKQGGIPKTTQSLADRAIRRSPIKPSSKTSIESSIPQKKTLVTRLKESIKESLKNPSVGLAIKDVSGPADETLRVGLSPVKGAIEGKYDDLVKEADKLFAEGKFDEATKIYSKIAQDSFRTVQERFKRTNIRVKANSVGFGVYEGVPEPNIDFTATVKPEDMDLFHNILSDLAEKDFKQHSFVTYKQTRLERDRAYGIVDAKKGISREPHLIFRPEKPLTLADVRVVNQALADAELPAMSIKEGGTRVDILHLTGYDKDYEIFSNKVHDFIKNLDSKDVNGTYEYATAEVRFVGDKGSSANTTYERSRSAFYKENKGFIKPDDIESKVLDAIRYKPTISKKELQSIVNSGEVSPTEKAVFREVLDEMKDGQMKAIEVQSRLRGKLLSLKPQESTSYTNYGWDNVFDSNYEGRAVVFDSNLKHGKGTSHFQAEGLFGHARYALTEEEGRKIATIGELQSDVFQHQNNIDHIKNFEENVLNSARAKVRDYGQTAEEYAVGVRVAERELPLNLKEIDRFEREVNKIEKLAKEKGLDTDYVRVEINDAYTDNKWEITASDGQGNLFVKKTIKKSFLDYGNEMRAYPEKVKRLRGNLESKNWKWTGIDNPMSEWGIRSEIQANKENILRNFEDYKKSFRGYKELYTKSLNEYQKARADYEKALAGGPNALMEQFVNFSRSNMYRQRLFEETVDYIMKTDKPDEIRVAKPSMVAKIEGYIGSGDDIAPYENPNGGFGRGADDLTYGDEVGYGGEPYIVVDVQAQGRGWGGPPPTMIGIVPEDKVSKFRLLEHIDSGVEYRMESVPKEILDLPNDSVLTKEQLQEMAEGDWPVDQTAKRYLDNDELPTRNEFMEKAEDDARAVIGENVWDDLYDIYGRDKVFSDERGYDPMVYVVQDNVEVEYHGQPSAYTMDRNPLDLDDSPAVMREILPEYEGILTGYFDLHNKIIPKYEQKIGQKFIDETMDTPDYTGEMGYSKFTPDYTKQKPAKKTF